MARREQPREQSTPGIDWDDVMARPLDPLEQRALAPRDANAVTPVYDVTMTAQADQHLREMARRVAYARAQADAQARYIQSQTPQPPQYDMFGAPVYRPGFQPAYGPGQSAPRALDAANNEAAAPRSRRRLYAGIGVLAATVALAGGAGVAYSQDMLPGVQRSSSSDALRDAAPALPGYPTLETDSLICGPGIKPLPVATAILRAPRSRIEIGIGMQDKQTNTRVEALTAAGLQVIAPATIGVCGAAVDGKSQTLAVYKDGKYIVNRDNVIMQKADIKLPPKSNNCDSITALDIKPKMCFSNPVTVGKDVKTYMVFLGDENVTQSPRYEKIAGEDARITKLTTSGVNNANAAYNTKYMQLFGTKIFADFFNALESPDKCAGVQRAIDESMTTYVESQLQNQAVKTPMPPIEFSGVYSGLVKAFTSDAKVKAALANRGINVVLNTNCAAVQPTIKPAAEPSKGTK